MRQKLNQATKIAAIAAWWRTVHALRRPYVSWLQAEGVPEDARARLLGRVPETTGDRHYADADLGLLADDFARIRLVWREIQAGDCEAAS